MTAKTDGEKRHFQRIFYDAEASLLNDEFTLPCRIVDISLKGCLLNLEKPWPGSATTTCMLILNLSDEASIRMKLTFAHGSGTLAGFKCDDIDIDSITNLRRLVELNLGDSALLERELSALGGW